MNKGENQSMQDQVQTVHRDASGAIGGEIGHLNNGRIDNEQATMEDSDKDTALAEPTATYDGSRSVSGDEGSFNTKTNQRKFAIADHMNRKEAERRKKADKMKEKIKKIKAFDESVKAFEVQEYAAVGMSH